MSLQGLGSEIFEVNGSEELGLGDGISMPEIQELASIFTTGPYFDLLSAGGGPAGWSMSQFIFYIKNSFLNRRIVRYVIRGPTEKAITDVHEKFSSFLAR